MLLIKQLFVVYVNIFKLFKSNLIFMEISFVEPTPLAKYRLFLYCLKIGLFDDFMQGGVVGAL